MSDIKPLAGNDLTFKPSLTATRKIGGRIVTEELEPPVTNDEDGLDQLMSGIDGEDIAEGRRKLMTENPHMAAMEVHEMLDIDAGADEVAQQFMDPVRIASSRRVGKLADKETGETLNFKRVGGTLVELTDENGQMLHKLSSKEFEDVLRSGGFDVL